MAAQKEKRSNGRVMESELLSHNRVGGDWSGRDARQDSGYRVLAKGLGMFSIVLGVAQIVSPRWFSRLIGAYPDGDAITIMRLVGMRELFAGLKIMTNTNPATWTWARVAGDVMDLALIGRAFSQKKANPEKLTTAAVTVLGITAADWLVSTRIGRATAPTAATKRMQNDPTIRHAITINRPVEEVYAFWHNFENLPRFMNHLESVTVTGERRSHWKASAPAGQSVEWDAEIVRDIQNREIAWQSLPDSTIRNSGAVYFEPNRRGEGTVVRVEMQYDAPGGAFGKLIAKLTGEEPELQVADDLRAFKQLLETGEILRSDGAKLGERLYHRPAQPLPPEKAKKAREDEEKHELGSDT